MDLVSTRGKYFRAEASGSAVLHSSPGPYPPRAVRETIFNGWMLFWDYKAGDKLREWSEDLKQTVRADKDNDVSEVGINSKGRC